MTKAIAQTYEVVHGYRMRITATLLAVSIFMALLYVINVYTVISHTVAVQKVNSEIAVIENTIENLDSKYLALSSKITPDNLNVYGLSQGKVTEYIAKTSSPVLGDTHNVSRIAMNGHEF